MQVELRRPFRHLEGHCWVSEPDRKLFPKSDDIQDPSRSCLIVSESDIDLGPAHSPIQMIGQLGRGMFSHWDGVLYFSSTDNSDPNANGRRYSIRWDSNAYFTRKAEYAVAVIESWARHIQKGVSHFRDSRVLEVGPGRDMGTILVLACLGARVVAVDRFFGDWQTGWHDEFVPALKAVLAKKDWDCDLALLDRVREARSVATSSISVFNEPLERLSEAFPGQMDFTVSHSTFEHFYDLPRAAAAIFQASAKTKSSERQASLGIHNVDFRDHRNFGEPLEFLLMDDKTYAVPASNDEYRRGNRVRPGQMAAALVRAGFNARFLPTEVTNPDYLTTFIPRLRKATHSRFATISRDELEILGGTFLLGA